MRIIPSDPIDSDWSNSKVRSEALGVGGRSKVLISISSDTVPTGDVRPASRAREVYSEKYTKNKIEKEIQTIEIKKKNCRTILDVSTL